MDRFTDEVGRALRRVRMGLGLTLRDVERSSDRRFKPSSVAGYERGERAISLLRFCELATFYGVPPDRLLTEVLEELGPEGRRELVIDLDRLTLVVGEEGNRVSRHIQGVRALRGERQSRLITLRSGDLEALALASNMRPGALVAVLQPALLELESPRG